VKQAYDIAIIGGGIVGTATALALVRRGFTNLALLEAEEQLAFHQSGRNSGVIHSGIYYRPGSLKARLCREGREALYEFCREHGIQHERCGKLIVATRENESATLDLLYQRGQENGLTDLRRLSATEIKAYEPNAAGITGLHVPQTGIVDYIQVVKNYARLISEAGGEVITGVRVVQIKRNAGKIDLNTAKVSINCRFLINCAGLQSDRVARMAGIKPGLQIIPFRGEYYALKPEKRHLVRNLIYPVPDPAFPFLGVHFTRRVDGRVEAGPNAVLALSRRAYRRSDFSLIEMAALAISGEFWKMAGRYWRQGVGEYYRSLNKAAFVAKLRQLLPAISPDDLSRGGSGLRAQAVDADGKLVDDFRIADEENMIHVLNAPSPAATASLKIGEYIADLALGKLQA